MFNSNGPWKIPLCNILSSAKMASLTFYCYTWPKKALANAKSYKLNNLSSASKGISKDGRGRFRQLMQVLAVGINVLVTSTNCKLGCSTNPNTGSSSAPVTNCRICDRDTAAVFPPTNNKGRSYHKVCIIDDKELCMKIQFNVNFKAKV